MRVLPLTAIFDSKGWAGSTNAISPTASAIVAPGYVSTFTMLQ